MHDKPSLKVGDTAYALCNWKDSVKEFIEKGTLPTEVTITNIWKEDISHHGSCCWEWFIEGKDAKGKYYSNYDYGYRKSTEICAKEDFPSDVAYFLNEQKKEVYKTSQRLKELNRLIDLGTYALQKLKEDINAKGI